uniref:NKG2-C type II integral membrane protein-like n=1 Tax=Diabrotica virgifera virgifera TaxID=50390 RepID=A0A6P7FW64_DIAVI
MMRLVLLAALLSISSSEDAVSLNPFKQSYVCPPKFIRQGHRCYFFSKEAITWSEALFQCREMHSNLAIIQNRNQDKLIRSFLSKKTLAGAHVVAWNENTTSVKLDLKPLTTGIRRDFNANTRPAKTTD